MQELFELLNKQGLDNDADIEQLIMHKWSIPKILDLEERLYNVIINNLAEVPSKNTTQFSFSTDSDISAQHEHCPTWSCRLSRIDELARFATFYSDSVYINNYFSKYFHTPSNQYEEFTKRYNCVGDIKILKKLEKLILNKIILFLPPLIPESGHICKDCFHKFVPDYKNISRYLANSAKKLSLEYLDKTEIIVTKGYEFDKTSLYYAKVSGSEELYQHGTIIWRIQEKTISKEFRSIIQKITPSQLRKGYQLSRNEIKESKINELTLELIFQDIWIQRALMGVTNSNLKYFTHREIDIKFLNEITKSKKFREYNNVIRNNIIYNLPIILDIPLESIFQIRKNDFDAFIVFRDSINRIVEDYIANKKILTPITAREIFDDEIKPKLSSINTKVKSIRDSHLKKARRDILISSGLLTFGVFSTFFIPPIATTSLALSSAEAIKGIKSIYDAFQVPDEIQNNNLYFLWNLLPNKFLR